MPTATLKGSYNRQNKFPGATKRPQEFPSGWTTPPGSFRLRCSCSVGSTYGYSWCCPPGNLVLREP
jgi:hypothetical protein